MSNWILVSLLVLHGVALFGQDSRTRAAHFNLKDQLAIQGYDPVSYFTGKPTEGKKEYSLKYRGVVYYFSKLENKELFSRNPGKYEPAFGGWCAYAMGNDGEKVKIDPETFQIVEGKIYLFYNFWGNNTLKTWNNDPEALNAEAKKQWQKWLLK